MNFNEAITIIDDEMEKWLAGKGWTFEFFEAYSLHGQCRGKDKIIRISKPMIEQCPPEEVTDTIRHEIAHAIVREHARENPQEKITSHGEHWKQVCNMVGARPQRTATIALLQPAKWIIGCQKCGWEDKKMRRIKGKVRCKKCKQRVKYRRLE